MQKGIKKKMTAQPKPLPTKLLNKLTGDFIQNHLGGTPKSQLNMPKIKPMMAAMQPITYTRVSISSMPMHK